jgi:Ni2+-binding GTPase involved in maturation of urease and hydrogenase
MIRKNTVVTIQCKVINGRGEFLESNKSTYLHGGAAIEAWLQQEVEGLAPGDTKTVCLKKGEHGADDNFTFEIAIMSVRPASPQEQKDGRPLHPLKIHLLSGFLGSGKTTAIEQACHHLIKNGHRVAVITNDQGSTLVDGQLFHHLGIPSLMVPNGCFCCNYNVLDHAIHRLAHDLHSPTADTLSGPEKPAILFAEAVGSCTDLVATVLKPLFAQHPECQTTISIFADALLLSISPDAFAPEIRYIYQKQLEEAQVLVVSKIDLVDDPVALQSLLGTRYPGKTILYMNSFEETDIAHWLQTLDDTSFNHLPSLDIDYDRYGEGEARLAWLDQRILIGSPSANAQTAALAITEEIYHRLMQKHYPIGHLKFLLDDTVKISYTLTGTPIQYPPKATQKATLLINARVQVDPEKLARLVTTAIDDIAAQYHCAIETLTRSSFKPAYPRPTHRMA